MNYPNTKLLISGTWQDSGDGRTMPVSNPATGEEIGRVAHAGIADLERAVVSAQAGFEIWKEKSSLERQKIMRVAATLMRERADNTARLLTCEQGKPLTEAKAEVLAAADIIDWFADEGMRVYGRIVPSRNIATRNMVLKDPVGPVAAFTPWNFPINQVVRKVAAALTTGCSILVKAAEETPASPAELIRAFVDAGVPPGVVGLVYGNPAEISTFLIQHPAVRKITFTGSTAVGKQLAAMAGQYMKRVTMELGGHAPVIICDDADLELAVRASGSAKFRNAGQICIAPTRFLVQRDVHDNFVAELVKFAQSLKVGDGLADGTTMGPLTNPRRVTAMSDLVKDAVDRGVTVLAGGERLAGNGNFYAPTVLANVPIDAKVFNEEPFGPIAAVRSFDTLDDAIAEANRLSYGLAGYAYTRSLKNAHKISQRVEVGMLWINQPAFATAEMPFGGVKDSGYGTEGGAEALEAYLNTRAVSIANV